MTDPGNAPEGTPNAPEGGQPAQPVTPPAMSLEDALKEVEKWKALSRKNEETAKANRSAAEELAALKERDLTEAQKLQRAAEKAATEASTAKAELARFKVAAEKGVPAELLTGTDEATLNAQADALIAFRGQSTPTPDFGQGARGAEPPQDANAWLRRMARGR